ncbi:hypothetical protein [Catalinimonas alkaloidigena]|nr:hypothetical protein [Catalinimonas alkaloidigena]
MIFLNSCGDTTEDPTPGGGAAPEITVTVDGEEDPDSVAAFVGDSIEVEVNITSAVGFNYLSVKKGSTELFRKNKVSGTTVTSYDTTFYYVPTEADTNGIVMNFEVADDNTPTAQTVTSSFVVTVTGMRTQTAVLLGGNQNTTYGSFYDVDGGGKVYKIADAKANSAMIDIVYFYGPTNLATLAAPDDESVDVVYVNSPSRPSTWDTQNSTKFVKTDLAMADFDAATAGTINATITESGDSKANELAEGDVVAFETADGQKGWIYVNSIDTERDPTTGQQEYDNGSITITLKIVN